MRIPTTASRASSIFFLAAFFSPCPIPAAEPGVDTAAPRFAMSQVGNFFTFQPANLVIEQGDYARWRNTGTSFGHTTTSGNPCVANGLWASGLNPGGQFTRQFLESPQSFPYFCVPHCGMGMIGQVTVTPRIALSAVSNLGQINLSWTGGGGTYAVNRSDTPGFVSAGTVILVPSGGDSGTTFSDALQPGIGGILYYLVTNKF
jgi:plastocyanin